MQDKFIKIVFILLVECISLSGQLCAMNQGPAAQLSPELVDMIVGQDLRPEIALVCRAWSDGHLGRVNRAIGDLGANRDGRYPLLAAAVNSIVRNAGENDIHFLSRRLQGIRRFLLDRLARLDNGDALIMGGGEIEPPYYNAREQYDLLRGRFQETRDVIGFLCGIEDAIHVRNLELLWSAVQDDQICLDGDKSAIPAVTARAPELRAWFALPENEALVADLPSLTINGTGLTAIPRELSLFRNLQSLNVQHNTLQDLIGLTPAHRLGSLDVTQNHIAVDEIARIRELLPAKCDFLTEQARHPLPPAPF